MPTIYVDKLDMIPDEGLKLPLQIVTDGYILAAPTVKEPLVIATDGWIWEA